MAGTTLACLLPSKSPYSSSGIFNRPQRVFNLKDSSARSDYINCIDYINLKSIRRVSLCETITITLRQ
jgi:hypothetical protein